MAEVVHYVDDDTFRIKLSVDEMFVLLELLRHSNYYGANEEPHLLSGDFYTEICKLLINRGGSPYVSKGYIDFNDEEEEEEDDD